MLGDVVAKKRRWGGGGDKAKKGLRSYHVNIFIRLVYYHVEVMTRGVWEKVGDTENAPAL